DPNVAVEIHAAGRADRRDPGRQVQLGKCALRRDDNLAVTRWLHLIEEMLVHADESRHDGAPAEIDALDRWRKNSGRRRLDTANRTVLDDDRSIVLSFRSGSVDHPHMGQRESSRRRPLRGGPRMDGNTYQRGHRREHTWSAHLYCCSASRASCGSISTNCHRPAAGADWHDTVPRRTTFTPPSSGKAVW